MGSDRLSDPTIPKGFGEFTSGLDELKECRKPFARKLDEGRGHVLQDRDHLHELGQEIVRDRLVEFLASARDLRVVLFHTVGCASRDVPLRHPDAQGLHFCAHCGFALRSAASLVVDRLETAGDPSRTRIGEHGAHEQALLRLASSGLRV